MKAHELIINEEFCDAIVSGDRNFDIQQNDRGYQKGDHIIFRPRITNPYRAHLTHDIERKEYEITYVLSGWGLEQGYVVFGFKEVNE